MESPGLTSDEASARLAQSGPNAMPDTETPLWRLALAKFWAPVPWMLDGGCHQGLCIQDP